MRYKKGKFLQIIDYDDLMEWLEKNQDKWDSRRFKRFALKIEPEWLRQKRILDSYEPKRKYQKWTRFEDLRLLDLFYKKRKTIKEISRIMERSYNSVDHRLSRIRPYKKVKTINLKEEEMKIYRHGDLIFKEIKAIPQKAIVRKSNIVAHGESGNSHTLTGEAEILDFMEKQFVRVNSPAEIIHPEHKTIKIDPGQYEVIHENEFDYFDEEIKRVQD